MIEILLTSVVIGSIITSIVNIIISLFNNYRLKLIEREKQKNDLISYRYKCLYDMLLKWKEYDTPFEVRDKEYSKVAVERIVNSFFDSNRKFQIISPLLDEKYKESINKLNEKGNKLLKELIEIESQWEKKCEMKYSQERKKILQEFIDVAVNYSIEIENVIQLQLKELLRLNDR